jgi:hypothetical protein
MARPMSKKAWEQRQAELNAYYDERSRWFAVDKDGNRVSEGDEVTTFRGEKLIFQSVSAFPTYGKSGKVLVRDPEVAEGQPLSTREFYPSVCDLDLRREPQGN